MGATVQSAPPHVSAPLRTALAVSGLTAVVAQVVLLRELLVAFAGNELSIGLTLAVWLAWTAIGSAALGRLSLGVPAERLFARLQMAVGVALFVSLLLAQVSRHWWKAVAGEAVGPLPMMMTALVALSVFCPVSGWLFAAGSRALAEVARHTVAESGSSMYLLEAVGATIGGVLASLILIPVFDSLQIASIVAVTNFLVAIRLLLRRKLRRVVAAMLVACGMGAIVMLPRLHLSLVRQAWPGFQVVSAMSSRYGSLAVVETEGNRSLIQNGVVLFTVPDLASAEEAVHFPLLEHPGPRSVLLIGGGLNGSIAEIRRHPTVEQIDYVELDPAVVKLTRKFFAQEWAGISADPRVHSHLVDGRLFVKMTDRRYDVIIINLPEPQTAQLNRFYTQEFFAEAAVKLASDGILAFHLRGAEEYISPELAEFLGSIRTTLRGTFPDVVVIPGENVHLLAARRPGLLTTDPQTLLGRLRERGIRTRYVSEYFLPFRMAPDRVADLNDRLAGSNKMRVNRDFTPGAYYFDVALWSGQFSSSYRDAFLRAARVPFRSILIALAAITALGTALLMKGRCPSALERAGAGMATAATGLSVMGAEVLLLLGFQAVYGYVYNQLAVMVAGFMAGMALGSWLALKNSQNACRHSRKNELRRLAFTQAVIAVAPLVLVAMLEAFDSVRSVWLTPMIAHLGFPLTAIACGGAGGYQFPIAMRVFAGRNGDQPGSPGALYALDLAGATIAAIAVSFYVLPVFGFFRGALLMVLPSLGAMVVIGAGIHRFNAALPAFRDQKTPGR